MRRRWSEPRDTRAAPYSPTQVATNTSPVCSETRRTPSRPRPCHPRKLDEAMATSLRDCGFYSSSVRILVWSCFFYVCCFDARHWSNRQIAHPRVLAAAREARAYWRSVRGI